MFPTVSPPGDVPAEDSDHGSLLRVDAWPQAGHLPVALIADPHGWSGPRAGSVQSLSVTLTDEALFTSPEIPQNIHRGVEFRPSPNWGNSSLLFMLIPMVN